VSSGDVGWHRLSKEASLDRLASRAAGLSQEESAKRRLEHGLNVLDEAPPRSHLALFVAQFADYMILVLLGAALIAGLIGDVADTLVIVAIVVLNAAPSVQWPLSRPWLLPSRR
jgi:Ca2+-transporting ATPase